MMITMMIVMVLVMMMMRTVCPCAICYMIYIYTLIDDRLYNS